MSRKYALGQFYLVGSELRFIRHGDPKLYGVDFDADEAAEFVASLKAYPGQSLPQGIRIFTSQRRKYTKTRLTSAQ